VRPSLAAADVSAVCALMVAPISETAATIGWGVTVCLFCLLFILVRVKATSVTARNRVRLLLKLKAKVAHALRVDAAAMRPRETDPARDMASLQADRACMRIVERIFKASDTSGSSTLETSELLAFFHDYLPQLEQTQWSARHRRPRHAIDDASPCQMATCHAMDGALSCHGWRLVMPPSALPCH
jgi:hypothetical protein